MAEIWYAQTRTWEGTGIGTHWYCTLRGPSEDQAYEVWYVMDQLDADSLSRGDFREKAGDPTGRFRSKQACFDATRAAFHSLAAEGDILLHDDNALNPSEVLVGPDSLNQVWIDAERETEPLEAYSREFYDRWEAELEVLGLSRDDYPPRGTVPIGNEIICERTDDGWRIKEGAFE